MARSLAPYAVSYAERALAVAIAGHVTQQAIDNAKQVSLSAGNVENDDGSKIGPFGQEYGPSGKLKGDVPVHAPIGADIPDLETEIENVTDSIEQRGEEQIFGDKSLGIVKDNDERIGREERYREVLEEALENARARDNRDERNEDSAEHDTDNDTSQVSEKDNTNK